MKVGILVECGRQGLEAVVCHRLCALLSDHTGVEFEFDIVPMDNKPRLIRECGAATALLLATGCDRVVILWDERPAWPKAGEQLCWHNDRQDILTSLRESRVGNRSVHLVCIERANVVVRAFDRRATFANWTSAQSRSHGQSQGRHDQPVQEAPRLAICGRRTRDTFCEVPGESRQAAAMRYIQAIRRASHRPVALGRCAPAGCITQSSNSRIEPGTMDSIH